MEAKQLLNKIDLYLDHLARNEWTRFISEDGTVELDRNALLHEALERIIREDDGKGYLDGVVEALESLPGIAASFLEMEITIREVAEDAKAWDQARAKGIPGMLRYIGMAVGDFV